MTTEIMCDPCGESGIESIATYTAIWVDGQGQRSSERSPVCRQHLDTGHECGPGYADPDPIYWTMGESAADPI